MALLNRGLQLRVLKVNINEEELTVQSHPKQLKVLSINTEGYVHEEIFQKLDRLSPPPYLEELYLRHYHGVLTPQWTHPTISLCHLQLISLHWKRRHKVHKSYLLIRVVMAPLERLRAYV